MENKTSSAFIAIVGRPNVGKSSLLNRLVGQKVAIVSDKPQTTRTRIMGVLTEGETQLVFLDTPGNHRPRTRLGDFMVKSITEAVSGVDAAMLVVEPTEQIRDEERELVEQFARQKLPVVLVINKIDTLADKVRLLPCIEAWKQVYPFDAVLPVSAMSGEGVEELKTMLFSYAFEAPHFFADDMISDQPEKVLVSEIVREKMLLLLQQEVPHGIAVVVEQMDEDVTSRGENILDIDVCIYCERESHKGMVIGKRGAMLKQIAMQARTDIETLLSTKVNLQCWVKVKEDWRNRQNILNSLGYRI